MRILRYVLFVTSLFAVTLSPTVWSQTAAEVPHVETKVAAPRVPVALDAGLAMTPPMGWNSWNKFQCNVDEKLIRETADALVASGMRDAGYEYLVIDDCWHGQRDAHGDIQPDPEHFPSGIKALADYVHSKGLKFGIYSDAGTKTCAGRPASRGYEFQDAAQYAAWGVDYLKYDWCNTSTQNAQASYAIMREALNHTGKPIVFSMCEWGTAKPWLWGAGIGQLWRTTGDIAPEWAGKQKWTQGFIDITDLNEPLWPYAGPGHWNDPDMLEVGNGSLTLEESKTHFSLWAMMAAPLMAGNDLTKMSPEVRAILMNKEIIGLDQDPVGQQGHRVAKDGDLEVWSRQIAGGNRAVLLLNRGKAAADIKVTWAEIGYPEKLSATIHDLWKGGDVGTATGSYTAKGIPAHGVVVLTIKP
jgi:alpha-galactosidase